MEQGTSTGHKRSPLPISLYPLPEPVAVRPAAGFEGAAASQRTHR